MIEDNPGLSHCCQKMSNLSNPEFEKKYELVIYHQYTRCYRLMLRGDNLWIGTRYILLPMMRKTASRKFRRGMV